ncbi:hypothetical protein HC248_01985 [Polaromonas vacuolata]|uniref:Uncharacterized protein n=1 Tax=Polaromonas vacuolata TaxID=37448 RepID=A0A6H2HB25_9BURK|nr:hypothetical protein HC248_01883 [Polaromonas vacuolata]QJC56676.1 hypothetical protein HC248_01985 [Polaromonas vacuolata]
MALCAALIKIKAYITNWLSLSFNDVEVLKIYRPMLVFIKPSQV